MSGGAFEVGGLPASVFTHAELASGLVSFVSDGTENPPAYDVDSLAAARAGDPWLAAGLGLVDDVLTPHETAAALRRLMALFGSDSRDGDGSGDALPESTGPLRVHEP